MSTHLLQAQTLSPQAEIRVMTLGPYQPELYSAFGHSAFRVYDPVRNYDIVYNYGVFTFKQKNFYGNFLRGKMLYKLGLSRYEGFKQRYISDNRFIYEQVLNLTQEEKQAVFDFLRNNSKPENADYLYNYVYDNCATKIRDVLRASLDGKVTFDTSYVEQNLTFRDLMDRYSEYQYWGDLGIDIGLGMPVDRVAKGEEYMFLPDYIYRSLSKSTIADSTGGRPLVLETEKVYVSKKENYETPMLTPFNFFVLLFLLVGFVTNINFKKRKRSAWLDYLLFGVTGLAGIFLLFLWFGTAHLSQWNLNVLWALPTHLIAAIMLRKPKYRPLLR
ncbi:MAG: DUF4105 domain-containing protein, partial [Bacteroidota bacterium]